MGEGGIKKGPKNSHVFYGRPHGHNLIISSNSIQFPAARRFFFHLQRIPRFRPTIWWQQISQVVSLNFVDFEFLVLLINYSDLLSTYV